MAGSKCSGGTELLNTMRITAFPCGSSTRPLLLRQACVSVLTGTDRLGQLSFSAELSPAQCNREHGLEGRSRDWG